MAEETVAAALEPFRQLDGSLARRFEGAGLGLSISKALIELHGGTLSIRSAVGEGTSVTLALPANRVAQRPDATPDAVKVA
jgi:signal transduction histidine kinase